MPSIVIVKLSEDKPVNLAVKTISKNIPATIVNYGSMEYMLFSVRYKSYTIWIGHGSQKGIYLKRKLISWKTLGNIVKNNIGFDIVLACDSYALNDLIRGEGIAIGIGKLDARIAALLALYIIKRNPYFLTKGMELLNDLTNGKIKPQFLKLDMGASNAGSSGGSGGSGSETSYIYCNLSVVEASYYTLMFVSLVVSFIVGYEMSMIDTSITDSIVNKATQILKFSGAVAVILQTFITYGYRLLDAMDITTFLVKVGQAFLGIFGAILQAIYNMMRETPGWQINVIVTLNLLAMWIMSNVLKDSASGGLSLLLELAIFATNIISLVSGLIQDTEDSNWWVG